MNKNKDFVKLLVVGALFFVFGIALGASFNTSDKSTSLIGELAGYTPPESIDLTPLWKAWRVIEEKYVPVPKSATSTEQKIITEKDKLWGMISGLANSLEDPYTTFLPPEDNKMFMEDMRGSFEGVGMEVTVKDGKITVVAPLKGTPAYKAGIKPGDIIVKIDGKSTENMTLDTAVKLIRGKRGTPVVLTIYREGEPEFLDIKIIRDKINIPTIETNNFAKEKVFYIRLMQFSANSAELFRQALSTFQNTNYKKLIIDLRGNPGGYLDAAVEIASWFLPEDKIVVTEYYGDDKEKPQSNLYSKGYNLFDDTYKIVVLVDKGSASASEILAGALKAHKKATLIGENTFGKGSVQELVPITKDTSLKLTIARWILPDGTYINSTGIKPDIEIKTDEETKKTDEELKSQFDIPDAQQDPILKKALEFLQQR